MVLSKMTNFNISIISDTVCPWCYIGLNRLTRAITTHKSHHPADTFTISWSPFYLNPSSSPYPGLEKADAYASKFGADRAAAIFSRLTVVGQAEGIKFSFGGRTGRTRDSHRVIWYAGLKEKEGVKGQGEGVGGLQTRVVERLFRAYFEEEGNITDHQVLLDAASAAGLEAGEAQKLLSSEEGGKEVDEEAEGARKQLVAGVPYFLVQGQYAVEGAEEPETFLEIFNKLKQ